MTLRSTYSLAGCLLTLIGAPVAAEPLAKAEGPTVRESRNEGPKLAPADDPRVKTFRVNGVVSFADPVTSTIKVNAPNGEMLALTGSTTTPVSDAEGSLSYSDLKAGDRVEIEYTADLAIKSVRVL